MKIFMLLNSGLGNQLFMIFAVVSYCIDNLHDYVLHYDHTKMRCYWDTILDKFQTNTTEKLESNLPIYEEPYFHYKRLPETVRDMNIKGYFQSYKYFAHNFQRIKEIMGLEEKKKAVASEYAMYFQKRKTIALHFRIGDYMGLQGYHCIKRPEYYIKAFEKLVEMLAENNETISNYDILYFCQQQDNHIVDQYLQIFQNRFSHANLRFVKIADDIADWKQLLLMSLCDHFIIANSTFSWFGAYLSTSYEKHNAIVCYPSVWFGPLYSHDTKDLCPSEWYGIPDS